MVGLAVPDPSTSGAAPENEKRRYPLRSHAIWSPDIPPEEVHLHDNSYAGEVVASPEYLPVIHAIFGGPKGVYLQYLTEITAVCSQGTIAGLEFSYQKNGSPIQRQKLHYLANSEELSRINFNISGPAGELVTSVQIGYGYRPNEGVVDREHGVDITSLVVSMGAQYLPTGTALSNPVFCVIGANETSNYSNNKVRIEPQSKIYYHAWCYSEIRSAGEDYQSNGGRGNYRVLRSGSKRSLFLRDIVPTLFPLRILHSAPVNKRQWLMTTLPLGSRRDERSWCHLRILTN